MFGVEDLDVADRLDVAGKDGARALLAHDHALGLVAFHADCDLLDVQDDVRDIFANAGDRGEFMQDAVDLHRRDGGAAQRGQEDTAQCVAERQAEATLKRLGDQSGLRAAGCRKLDLVRLDQFLPVFLDHFVLPSVPYHHPIVATELENQEERRTVRWQLIHASDAPLLARAAAIVRNWCHVTDRRDGKSCGLKCTKR